MKNTNKSSFGLVLTLVAGLVYLSSFTLVAPTNNEVEVAGLPDAWKDYKSWTKITKEPNTGDPTGFLSKKHGGVKAYRDIFVNPIGADAYINNQFPLPEGTIVIKEAFKNKAAWEAQSKPEFTVMEKLATGSNPDTGDWKWFMGDSGSEKMSGKGMDTKWGKFCASCHVYGQQADYTFMSTHGK